MLAARKHQRHQAALSVEVTVGNQSAEAATTENVSLGGMFIHLQSTHTIGTNVSIRVPDEKLTLPAVIVRVQREPRGVGVEFQQLGRNQREHLARWIAKHCVVEQTTREERPDRESLRTALLSEWAWLVQRAPQMLAQLNRSTLEARREVYRPERFASIGDERISKLAKEICERYDALIQNTAPDTVFEKVVPASAQIQSANHNARSPDSQRTSANLPAVNPAPSSNRTSASLPAVSVTPARTSANLPAVAPVVPAVSSAHASRTSANLSAVDAAPPSPNHQPVDRVIAEARAFVRLGQFDFAEKLIVAVLVGDPNHPAGRVALLLIRAQRHQHRGEETQATVLYQRVLAYDPRCEEALVALRRPQPAAAAASMHRRPL